MAVPTGIDRECNTRSNFGKTSVSEQGNRIRGDKGEGGAPKHWE